MTEYNWPEFLRGWSQELLESPAIRRALPDEVLATGWLGFPGATPAELAAAEARLGVTLPPSYRAFLATSNGWRATGPFIPRVWSTAEIDWFAARNADWIAAYVDAGAGDEEPAIPDAQYRVYEPNQAPFRLADLPATLEISATGDQAVYLLNPQVVAAGGEWEAWFFANWKPGADRYRSFWDLLQAQRETFRLLRQRGAG